MSSTLEILGRGNTIDHWAGTSEEEVTSSSPRLQLSRGEAMSSTLNILGKVSTVDPQVVTYVEEARSLTPELQLSK